MQSLMLLTMTVAAVRFLLVLGLCCPSFSFSSGFHIYPVQNQARISTKSLVFGSRNPSFLSAASLIGLRGGDQADSAEQVTQVSSTESEEEPTIQTIADTETRFAVSLAPMASKLAALGAAYGASLEKNPIPTKSVTAGVIFALSDWLAQRLTPSADGEKQKTNWTRTISSALVGLLYFGPAAHFWYETIFRLLPGTSLLSTLQKAALGQLLFGPSFTCIFFATSLLQQGKFTFQNWFAKIKQDLPGAWVAGLGFWPLVDLISYSLIPKNWIPLFVNTCSLVWTIYLSMVANRQATNISSSTATTPTHHD